MTNLRGIPCKERLLLQCTKDETTSCWNWNGSKDRSGYGYIKRNGVTTKAHRASYEEFVESIQNGLWILHKCDNPSCINPDHLYQGTPAQNMKDRKDRGRGSGWKGYERSGEKNPNSKITKEIADRIREEYKKGLGPFLANKYGLHVQHILKIVWKQVWV